MENLLLKKQTLAEELIDNLKYHWRLDDIWNFDMKIIPSLAVVVCVAILVFFLFRKLGNEQMEYDEIGDEWLAKVIMMVFSLMIAAIFSLAFGKWIENDYFDFEGISIVVLFSSLMFLVAIIIMTFISGGHKKGIAFTISTNEKYKESFRLNGLILSMAAFIVAMIPVFVVILEMLVFTQIDLALIQKESAKEIEFYQLKDEEKINKYVFKVKYDYWFYDKKDNLADDFISDWTNKEINRLEEYDSSVSLKEYRLKKYDSLFGLIKSCKKESKMREEQFAETFMEKAFVFQQKIKSLIGIKSTGFLNPYKFQNCLLK